MKHLKNNFSLNPLLNNIYSAYFPTKKDNLFQLVLKVIFLAILIFSVVFTSYCAVYFEDIHREQKIIENNQKLWNSYKSNSDAEQSFADSKAFKAFYSENRDFKGWLNVGGGDISAPVYQTDNNNYYINHNSQKQESSYGALFFDKNNKITEKKTDSNLVIYGNSLPDGSLFGNLYKLRSLSYLKENYTITLSLSKQESTYKIFAVLVLNATKEDDNNHIFDIYGKSHKNEDIFNSWKSEALNRSFFNTATDLKSTDSYLTLVTRSEDFENSRLVIIARKVREGENPLVNTSAFILNPSPRYPKKWYSERGIS